MQSQVFNSPDGKNYWPYCDSYVPKLKLIKDDMIPVKDRLHRQNQIGVLNYDQLTNRKVDIGAIEDQYREKVKEAAGINTARKDAISKQWLTKTIVTTEKIRGISKALRNG